MPDRELAVTADAANRLQKANAERKGQPEVWSARIADRDPIDQMAARSDGNVPGAKAHATALNHATGFQPARAGRSLLQLQRRYGNHYVEKVVALAREDSSHDHSRVLNGTEMLRGRSSLSHRPGSTLIARKKEDPSPFKGWAGEADVRAAEAGKEAGGFSPIKISTEYATQQAERKEKQMDAFRHEDIPFVNNNQEHYAYKKLISLRQEYIEDVTRITLAQGAFNDFVMPGTVANKSTAQFKQIQLQLGFGDYDNPSEDLSKKQLGTLAKNLDEKKIRELNDAVTNKENETRGKRTEILGTSHNVQAALQRRAGLLAVEEKDKADKEKSEIDEKIKAVTEGVETVGKVIEALSFAGFGAPEAIEGIAEGGTKAVKGGLELGSKGTSLIGATVGFVMTQMYKEQIEKAKQEIEKAKEAEAQAKKMDAALSYTGSMLQVQGQFQELTGFIGDLSAALEARKAYFAELGAKTEKQTGTRSGGEVSQYLAYVSQANETASQIETAKAAANNGIGVMDTQIHEIEEHRNYAYVANSAGVWDDRARMKDGDGPDLAELKGARDGLNNFIKSADQQLEIVHRVINSLPSPT